MNQTETGRDPYADIQDPDGEGRKLLRCGRCGSPYIRLLGDGGGHGRNMKHRGECTDCGRTVIVYAHQEFVLPPSSKPDSEKPRAYRRDRDDQDGTYDADCPICLRGRAHTDAEHYAALRRSRTL